MNRFFNTFSYSNTWSNPVLIVLFFLLLFSTSQSQTNYQFTTYTQENGLPSGTIREIRKDKAGFIWLLSENGLTRFDGYTFKKFYHNPNDSASLSSIDVRDMYENTSGNILFQTVNELSSYIPATFSFKKVISLRSDNPLCTVLGVDKGFWIVKKNGVVYLDSSLNVSAEFTYPSGFHVNARRLCYLDKNKLFLSNGKSLLLFDTDSKSYASLKIKLTGNLPMPDDHRILFLINGPNNNPYFYSTKGVFKFDSSTNTFNQLATTSLNQLKTNPIDGMLSTGEYLVLSFLENLLFTVNLTSGVENWIDLRKSTSTANSNVRVTNLSTITPNSIWISSSNQGIFEVQLATSTFRQIGNSDNLKYRLPTTSIDKVLGDGNVIWLISSALGLIKAELLHPLFETYRPYEQGYSETFSLSNNIRTIAELDRNTLLVGGLEGLYSFNRNSKKFSPFYPYNSSQPLLEKVPISKIIKDKEGKIWISVWGQNGIYVLSKDYKIIRLINPLDYLKSVDYKSIRSIFIDTRNNLWVGTDNNLILRAELNGFNINKNEPIKFQQIDATPSHPADHNFAICFAFNETKKGDILIGTQNGFYEYRYSDNSFKRYINSANNDKSISCNDVRSIYIDKNEIIWLATNGGGLNSFDPKTQQFNAYTTANGMPDNSVYSVLEDQKGILWMGTNKGLCAFNKEQKTIRSYLLKDGIQNYEFNTNSSCKTQNGELVFGGINGINIFNPEALELKSDPPKIVITEFKVLDLEHNFNREEINLGPNENDVSFQFAALNYYRNSENNYAYKLEGINKDWVYCGDRRFINYANLSPGHYLFRVKVANSFGVWSSEDAQIKFSIATPWYKTWFFYFVVILLLGALIYLIYRYRLQQAIELQSVRNSIARDLHDEIGSNLSSISLFTEVARDNNSENSSNVSSLLQKISEYTQNSQEAMNDIVWMINTRNDRFENIIIRIRVLAGELLEAKNIDFELHFDERLNQLKMGMNERKNFYLIYKEGLNNIVKYSKCTKVWIDLSLNHSQVILRIKDNGIGYNQAEVSSGNGLINMQKRAEVLKGILNIESKPGIGTTLDLKFTI